MKFFQLFLSFLFLAIAGSAAGLPLGIHLSVALWWALLLSSCLCASVRHRAGSLRGIFALALASLVQGVVAFPPANNRSSSLSATRR